MDVMTNGSSAGWHTLAIPDFLSQLQTAHSGLGEEEAAARYLRYGPNLLPRKLPPSVAEIFIRQFFSPLIYILCVAAAVSLWLGDYTDAGFIGAVLLINSVIGGYQEWRADRSAQALQNLLRIKATVEREGVVREIEADNVVPGDVIWLESGARVPADLRLISSHGLEVDESLLTGESIVSTKDSGWLGDTGALIADRRNMTYAGTMVIRGRGKGVTVATGTRTEVGKLALDVLGAAAGKPPLISRMERFSRVIAVLTVGAAGLIGAAGVIFHGYGVADMFLFGVALTVSAIPEGLPAALTVALAIATSRMAKRGVIVRRLAAVEGLGSCTLIASDKTGTLTCNELTVKTIHTANGEIYHVSGKGFKPEGSVYHDDSPVAPGEKSALDAIVRAAVLCNEAELFRIGDEWNWRGDPTDVALLSLAHKQGLNLEDVDEAFPQVNQIPYEPEYRFAASYHTVDGETAAYVKGAPERVLAMCEWGDAVSLRNAGDVAESMAANGYRVLALAYGIEPAAGDVSMSPPSPSGLRFLGFIGMLDPLRKGVREAIASCGKAGIRVAMITGDHPVTAYAIGRDLGLVTSREEVVEGGALDGRDDDEIKELVEKARVFARVTPHQKLRLVEAMRASGQFVAVTGDGVNDAPALRAANIGVAMGKSGTDVAREAAELVITDDNFTTIVAGVEEGRIAYDNIRKMIYLLGSCGAGEVVVVGLAVAAGTPLPFLPAQLLWLNLVTNGIQGAAMAFEPGEGDELSRKPRSPKEPVFNRLMIERTIVAALVMAVVGFLVFAGMLHYGASEASARNALLLLFVLFENVHVGNCRSETKSAFALSPLRNPLLFFGTLLALGLHIIMMYLPVGQKLLQTEPLSVNNWLIVGCCAMTILLAMETHKWIWTRRNADKR